jgi:hypothetical protein
MQCLTYKGEYERLLDLNKSCYWGVLRVLNMILKPELQKTKWRTQLMCKFLCLSRKATHF